MTVFACYNVGVSCGEVFVMETPEGFEARAVVALLGYYQMSEEELEAIAYNPFHADFDDNYAKGKGVTREAAIEALKADLTEMSNNLWR